MRVTGDHKLDINHIEKLITILLAGLAVVLISDQYLVTAFIVAGLPHILLAYVQQYRARQKPLESTSILLFVLILTAAFLWASQTPAHFIAFVSLFTIMHHYYDDLKLSGLANNIWRTAYVIPLLVNLTLYSFYPFLLNETVVNALNLLPPLAGIALLFRRDFYTIPVYYCALNIIVTGLLYASITDHRHIWLFLILGHYMLWYIKMGYKFMRTDRPKYTRFVTECITLNILVFLAWLASTEFQNSLAVIHTMFFQPQSFWVWTLMHYIYTIRIIDYLNLSPRRNKLQRT